MSADQFDRALAVTPNIPFDAKQCDALVMIINALANDGQIDRALAILPNIPDPYHSKQSDALIKIVGVLANKGQIDQALALVPRMPDQTIAPDANNFPFSRDTVIKDARIVAHSKGLVIISDALVKSKQINLALAIVRTIPDEQEQSDAFVTIADALTDAGQIDRAFAIVDKLADPLKRCDALIKLAGRLANKGQSEQASQAFSQALARASKLINSKEQANALIKMAHYPLSGELNDALAELAISIMAGRENLLSGIVGPLAQMGNATAAHRLLMPCAFYLGAASNACSSLAILYPDQAVEIAELLMGAESA